ncbi:MAG: TrkA family potassium uptake protein [Ignavibacteria bacterium]|jgi:trk system potassium uptake protein TrkA|nr:TrkA family potassium uptake protein [Ignavibacteria bacterium]
MANKKFCVIGLGYFGYNLALSLTKKGAEVLAIDKNPERVEPLQDIVSYAVTVDSTDAKAMQSLGVKEMDATIVAIGELFEASIVTTAVLQEIGVRKIFNRVLNPIHERLLNLLNVTETLVPEAEAAEHLADRLILPDLIESHKISEDYSIYEIKTPDWLIGRSVLDSQLRQIYSLNIVTVKREVKKYGLLRQDEKVDYMVLGIPQPDFVFSDDDILVLFGKEKDFFNFLGD